jgi:intracellular multiplication protein IcmP
MSNQNQQGEPAFVLLMIIALLAGLGWVFWHLTGAFWMNDVLRWLRFGELWVINLFTHRYDACLSWLRYAQVGDNNPTPAMVGLTNQCFSPEFLSAQPNDKLGAYYMMSLPPLIWIGDVAASYFRWPLAVALASIGIKIMFFSVRNQFQTKHTLESFITTQAKMWPVITPIVKFNPSKLGRILGSEVPDKLPMFAEPLSPEEWVSWCRIPVVNGIPDRDAARRAFTQQLGPRWSGIDNAPDHIRALFAAFASKGAQHRDESDEILGRMALAWSPEKGFRMDSKLRADVDKLIKAADAGQKALQVADQHAYRTTAMLGVLKWARAMGGVLAPAQFVWLRAEDRPLWYPLNNMGRRSYHSEGAGAMAHFMAEEAAKKPLPIPRVETAYATLKTYLVDPEKRTIPIPPRETSKA